jgi:proteasome lid subunit RPN8/RPN11
MIVLTDRVVADIGRSIATHEPERGGALLGLPYSNVICSFIADPQAKTSHVTYQPSAHLRDLVQQQEISRGLQFFGIVHSHPGNCHQPSTGDHIAFLNSLKANPHLSGFVAPIVTLDREADADCLNEVSLSPRGRLTCYVAYRPRHRQGKSTTVNNLALSRAGVLKERFRGWDAAEDALSVRPLDCTIMPIGRHMASVLDGLRQHHFSMEQESGYLSVSGCIFQTETLRADQFEIIFLFPPTYPVTRPFLLFTNTARDSAEATRELEFNWPFDSSQGGILWTRCGRSVLAAISGEGEFRPATHYPDDTIS